MSAWTHRICQECWTKREGFRPPSRIVGEDAKPCCFCGELTDAGIFVRHNPKELECKHE